MKTGVFLRSIAYIKNTFTTGILRRDCVKIWMQLLDVSPIFYVRSCKMLICHDNYDMI